MQESEADTSEHVTDKPWFKHYAPGVPKHIAIPDITLHELLRRSAERFPGQPCLDFIGLEMSYAEVDRAVDRLADALQKLGIAKGDRVGLMLPNCPQMVIGFFAVNRIGAVIVNVNPIYTARELDHQLNDAGVETLILLDRVYPTFAKVASAVPVKRVIVTGIQDYLSFPKNLLFPLLARFKGEHVSVPDSPTTYRFRDLIKQGDKPLPVAVNNEELALLQYTGGTTGRSKGAMLSNRNIVANIMMIRVWDQQIEDGKDCSLLVIPFFHVYGMTVGMGVAVQAAAKMVLLPRFDVKDVLAAIDKHRPKLFPGIPTIYVAINNYPEVKKYNLTSIRTCISGAAPLPSEVKNKFEELTGANLVEGYGLTEASPVTHSNPVGGKVKIGSVGVPFPNVDARIINEAGEDVAQGEIGEIIVKGPNIMMGYWNQPEVTAETIKDGWLYTGDMVSQDEEGYYYIQDRKNDMIIASGYNIYPREIEEVLYMHPAVMEAVVIGVPHEYRGETVKAFVVLKEGQRTSEEEIKSFCSEHLAKYKVPKLVAFRDDLPKSLVGKILRRKLRDEEKEQRAEAEEQAEDKEKASS